MILKFLKRYNYLFVVIVVGVAISCDNAQNHIGLGDKFVLEGKSEKAIEEYKRAIEMDTNAADVYYKLGNIYFKKEMLEEAVKEYRKAIELRPDFLDAHKKLSEAYTIIGVPDDKLAIYTSAIRMSPKDSKARIRLGIYYQQLKRMDLAFEQYNKVLEYDPYNP